MLSNVAMWIYITINFYICGSPITQVTLLIHLANSSSISFSLTIPILSSILSDVTLDSWWTYPFLRCRSSLLKHWHYCTTSKQAPSAEPIASPHIPWFAKVWYTNISNWMFEIIWNMKYHRRHVSSMISSRVSIDPCIPHLHTPFLSFSFLYFSLFLKRKRREIQRK